MDNDLFEVLQRPRLVDPVLIVGLEGWIDAGMAAGTALTTLLESVGTTVTVASFDADRLVDHRSRRPVLHLVEGVNTGLTWPSIELRAASDPDGRDLLVLVGAEPDYRWQAFADAVVGLAADLGAALAVGLGAYPAAIPHTRPSLIATTASSKEMATRVGHVRATIDVPAGAGAAIERRCAGAGFDAVGLWAQVPHYASAMPYPAASVALLEALDELTGLAVGLDELRGEATATRQRIDQLIEGSEEHIRLVRQLEAQFDAETATMSQDLPSGDELAAELQRFLREHDRGNADG